MNNERILSVSFAVWIALVLLLSSGALAAVSASAGPAAIMLAPTHGTGGAVGSPSLSLPSMANPPPQALPPRMAGAAYSAGQNPMGLADFGQTGSGTDFYTSSSFKGTATVNSLSVCASSSPCGSTDATFQLNTVLGFENGGSWYVYWVQDVAWVNTANNVLFEFENNIWNFSGPSSTMYSSTVSGNGQIYSPGYYAYSVGSSFSYPSTFELILNTSVNGNGEPIVQFMYDTGSGFVTYDLVTFSFVRQLAYSDGFIVDGGANTPNGLYYDAEFVVGGPGGGSNAIDEAASIQFYLDYWNGKNYQGIQNAEDHGEDTGETVTNTEVYGAYYTASGSLFAQFIAGTENIDLIWVSSQVATVDITGPGSCDGVLYSATFATPYLAGSASITVWPVSPDFSVSCEGYTLDLGTYALSAGGTTTLSAGSWADLVFGETGLPSGATWGVAIQSDVRSGSSGALTFYLPIGSYTYSLRGGAGYLPSPSAGTTTLNSAGGSVTVSWQSVRITVNSSTGSRDTNQPVEFAVSLTGAAGDSFSWSGLPTGCASADTALIACSPTSPGSFQVFLMVTDTNGFAATSPTLDFVVYSDPSLALPLESRTSSDVGQTVTFSTVSSPGSGGDSFTWSGLPLGCTSADATTVTCAPTVAGTYSFSARVVDSNGFVATAGGIYTVYALPVAGPVSTSPGPTILAGDRLTFTVNATAGSGGLVYAWNGLPPGCQSVNAPSFSCTPSAAGTWAVSVSVTDSNHGNNTSPAVSITVEPSFLGLPALEGYLFLGTVVAAAVLGTIFILVVRKRHQNK